MSGTSLTSPYSTIYAFGDSLSDAGNVSILTSLTGSEPVSPPYYSQSYGVLSGTVFSNGPTWVQNLSQTLGLGKLAPSLAGGNDFAYGGAETGSTPQNSGDLTEAALSVPAQLTQFETQVGGAPSSALYTLSIGSNDLLAILSTPTLTAAQRTADVQAAVNNEVADINRLARDGGRQFLVFDVPDLGITPYVTGGLADGGHAPDPALDVLATSLSQQYDGLLYSQLAAAAAANGYNYHILDAYDLTATAAASPAAFGLTNSTQPVWTGSFTNANSGTLAASTTAAQDQYLFWDTLHPTEAGHSIIANVAQSLVQPSLVFELDQTQNASAAHQASAYLGADMSIHSQFADITTDSVALFAGFSGMYLSTGSGNDIVVANSGANVINAGGGSNYLVGGTGTASQDTYFVDGTGSGNTWNALVNFHTGDAVTVVGYVAGVSKLSWNAGTGQANSGATLSIDLTGNGTSFANDTFVGVSLANAQKFAVVTGGSGTQSYVTVAA